MQRQTWSNQITYILTVAGATIGFGAWLLYSSFEIAISAF